MGSSIPQLTRDNWQVWKQLVKSKLIVKGVWPAVEATSGAAPSQSGTTTGSGSQELNISMDAKAMAYLQLLIGTEHLALIASEKSAAAAWQVLQNTFQPSSAVAVMDLLRCFLSERLKPNMETAAHASTWRWLV